MDIATPIQPQEPVKYSVPSVDSTCRILRHVCNSNGPVHFKELVSVSGTSRTTALRITSSLVENQFLTRTGRNSFEPGEFLRELGERHDLQMLIRRRAPSVLEALAESTEETAHLALPGETYCILEKVAHSPRPVRVASQEGSHIYFHCSSTGKAILAFDGPLREKLQGTLELTRRTEHTICDWPELEKEFSLIREQGYAVDEQEYHNGVRCVAVPLIDEKGSVLGAIGMTGATTTLTRRRLPSLVKSLQEAAEQILSRF
jgi:DNA-binding IclR family transcriptional regulator